MASELIDDNGKEYRMDREQIRMAEKFIRSLGLTPGQYEKKERHNGYELYIATSSKRLRFGHVRLNVGGQNAGKVTVYATGDIVDPNNRFTAQPSNSNVASYKFNPDDRDAWDYAVKVVLSAYRSRV